MECETNFRTLYPYTLIPLYPYTLIPYTFSMSLLTLLSRPVATYSIGKIERQSNHPSFYQKKIFNRLIREGKKTKFGKEHNFNFIKNYEDFKARVPVRDYEEFKPYIELIKQGESNVLWPGVPLYFCKTSGTVSGVKYIPITKDSMPNHINSTRSAILHYIHRTGKSGFLKGKWIFFSGSPEMYKTGSVLTGRLSGIVNHHVPAYLRTNQMPSYKTNCIEDWEQKIDAIVEETLPRRMTLFSGIPPWVQMYFEKVIRKTGKKIKEVFPHFSLFVYGGVSFEPYRKKFEEYFGGKVDTLELYPASEGFIAYQDAEIEKGLLMLVNSGIFYEFIPAEKFFQPNPPRLTIEEVKTGVNYALIINSNAGLWGYSIGDTVKFISQTPPRIQVTGRIKHFISAFGEHVIAEEVEKAMELAINKHNLKITEFTVAPQVNPAEGLPYHEWFVEFSEHPSDISSFAMDLNQAMADKNIYYRDLIKGNILKPLVVTLIRKGGFLEFMKEEGKLGGQNKPPRLSNDRSVVDKMGRWKV